MKTRLKVLTFALMMPSFCSNVDADTVWLVGEQEPVYGVVESSDESSIRFRQTADGKTFESVLLDRTAIVLIVSNFDRQRLTALVPGDWQTWHQYAEELMSQERDPVARNLAMRLLVIVVGNSSNAEQRDAALADLISLARNDDEFKKLQRIRYLETGVKPPQLKKSQPEATSSPVDRIDAIQLVQSIRNGELIDEQLRNEQLKATIDTFENACSWQELVRISKSNRIDDQQLRSLVALEYQLRISDAAPAKSRAAETSWHLLAGRAGTSSLTLPTIENVTEFDPSQTSFVDGKWIQR